MKIRVVLTRAEYNALFLCKAKPDEVRKQLRAVHINVDKQRLEASNGHRVVTVTPAEGGFVVEESDHSNVLFELPKKAIKRTEGVIINIKTVLGEWRIDVIFISVTGRLISSEAIIVDRDNFLYSIQFSNVQRVIDGKGKERARSVVAFNPCYLSDIAEEFHPEFPMVTVKFHGDEYLVAQMSDTTELIVMAARI